MALVTHPLHGSVPRDANPFGAMLLTGRLILPGRAPWTPGGRSALRFSRPNQDPAATGPGAGDPTRCPPRPTA